MKIITKQLNIKTKGAGDLINIDAYIEESLIESGLKEGSLNVFLIGSTAAITSFEYEPGLIADMKDAYERIAPSQKPYNHDESWGDANGFSHVRAALQGPSLVIPFSAGKFFLGTWQQVVLAEFDTRPRDRKIVLQFMGE